jgi:hypothetical protein
MEIRITQNSIRFRLGKSEVSVLAQQHSLTEVLEFGALQQDPD